MRRASVPSDAPKPARRDSVVLAAICAALAQVALVWLSTLPLGVPGEWVWERIAYGPGEAASFFLALFVAIPAAAAYLWFCRAGDARLPAATARGRALWLAGLTAAGFAWLWVVQEAAPSEIHRLGRAPVVLYYPAFSGYFTEAREAEDFGDYLAGYEELMAEGDVLHIGTHPPGLATLHRILLELYESSPLLTDLTLAVRPHSVREAEAMLSDLPGTKLTRPELAELWAAALLTQAAAAAAAFPLYHLATRSTGAAAGWRAACLWPLVPAVAIFLPKSDALFPLIGLGVLALWHRPGPPDPIRAVAAGVLFWFGMTLSLVMLPIGVLAAALSLQSIATAEMSERRRLVPKTASAVGVAAAAFLVLTGAVWLLLDLNLFTVWSWNYRNHAAFYAAYERTYWKWLLVNPWELAAAVGLPTAVAGVAGIRKSFTATSAALPIAGVMVLLWLSGKNSGEAARLWLFLMPWLLWAGAAVWEGDRGKLRWRTILLLQLVVSFLTAVRVSGFGFAELMGGTG